MQGEPHLPIEDGAAVVKLDAEGGDEQNGTHHQKTERRRDDVEDAFRQRVLGVDHFPLHEQNGRIERRDMPGVPHNRVADVREEKPDDAGFGAIFQDFVPAVGIDARDEDRLVTGKPVFDFRKRAVELNLVGDAVETFHRFADDRPESAFIETVPINEKRLLLRIGLVIELVPDVRPENVDRKLNGEEYEEGNRTDERAH